MAGLGCLADLGTKHVVFQWRGIPRPGEPEDVWWLWEGFVGISTTTNDGALFGLGKGQVPLFAALSVVALVGILGWLIAGRAAQDLALTVILGLVSAGILGNLYDRLGLWSVPGGEPAARIYAVRDWILLRYRGDPRWTWPNFNLADSMLVCGAVLLIWKSWRAEANPK